MIEMSDLDNNAKESIQAIVERLTDVDEMFTILDITKMARKHIDDKIEFRDVREVVYSLFDNSQMPSDYIHSLIPISTPILKSPTATVFHPKWKTATDYESNYFDENNIDPFQPFA